MPRSPYSLRMSATGGPIVPSISGRVLDLFEPSSVTVMDRLAEPLMRVSLLSRRGDIPAVRRLPVRPCPRQNYGVPDPDATFAVAAFRLVTGLGAGCDSSRGSAS